MNDNNLPNHLIPGTKNSIGSYTFEQDDIIRFATKYDNQYFHTDPVAAKDSLFGSLCASGWHTISVWMKLQRQFTAEVIQKLEAEGKPTPELGPSPGMRDIKWPRPVFVGDCISYYSQVEEVRRSNSRPTWSIMSQNCTAHNQDGDMTLSFKSSVFIRIP